MKHLFVEWFNVFRRFIPFALIDSQSRRNKYIAFLVAFIALFLFLCFKNVTYFYHDSGSYWHLSNFFKGKSIFTIFPTNFPLDSSASILFSIRGYAFPMILYILRGGVLDSIILFWLLWSAFFSYAFTWVCPDVFEVLSGKTFSVLQRIFPLFLLVFIWPGQFIYPLTDVFAWGWGICILRIAIFIKMKVKYSSSHSSKIISFLLMLLSGIMIYMLYNIRSAWILSCIVMILIFLLWLRNCNILFKFSAFIVLVLGILVASIPQIVINMQYYDKFTPQNPLQLNSTYGTSNFLYIGMSLDRYESHPDGASLSLNPMAQAIFRKEGIVNDSLSIYQFIKICLKYPLEVLGIYVGHFINSIDARYGEVYVEDWAISWAKTLKVVFLHLLWFIGLINISTYLGKDCSEMNTLKRYSFKSRELNNACVFLKRYGLIVLSLCFTSVIALVTHVEPRYQIAMYILLLFYLCLFCSLKSTFLIWKMRPITTTVFYLFLLGTFCSIWNWTLGYMPQVDLMLK